MDAPVKPADDKPKDISLELSEQGIRLTSSLRRNDFQRIEMIQYRCHHCETVFEAEEREGIECPRCFWSSSVTRDEGEAPKGGAGTGKGLEKKGSQTPRTPPWVPALIAGFFVVMTLAVLVLAGIFAVRFKTKLGKDPSGIRLSPEPAADKNLSSKKEPPSTDSSIAGLTLKPEEEAVLSRRLEISEARPLSEEERKILEKRASFSTGFQESIPSKVWTEEEFKKLLEDQQRLYGVPLPWSYKRKLQAVFKDKYLAGETAFQAGDLLRARDLWVESLAYPIYGNDLRLHRGVVLTILRPFIADTLSKIGSIHTGMAGKQISEKERAVAEGYQKLCGVLGKQDWEGALKEMEQLDRDLDALENPQLLVGETPPYPASVRQVDEGIQATLMELLQVPAPSVSSLNELRADLQQKKSLAESFQGGRVREMQAKYAEAMDALQRREFAVAEKLLGEVDFPLALYEDAQAKIKVLRRLQGAGTQAARPVQSIPVKKAAS